MANPSEFLTKSSESLISAPAKTAFVPTRRSVVVANRGTGSVTLPLEPKPKPALHSFCLWCGRTFMPRATGGSAQRFCCVGHRQQFWIAARRWTMRAIEAGLLSVDCLKGRRACTLPERRSGSRVTSDGRSLLGAWVSMRNSQPI